MERHKILGSMCLSIAQFVAQRQTTSGDDQWRDNTAQVISFPSGFDPAYTD